MYIIIGGFIGIEFPQKIEYHKNGNILSKCYCKNNKTHREKNMPAIICYYENGNIELEQYCQNGKIHRENRPAYIRYYINNNTQTLGLVSSLWTRNAVWPQKGSCPCRL